MLRLRVPFLAPLTSGNTYNDTLGGAADASGTYAVVANVVTTFAGGIAGAAGTPSVVVVLSTTTADVAAAASDLQAAAIFVGSTTGQAGAEGSVSGGAIFNPTLQDPAVATGIFTAAAIFTITLQDSAIAAGSHAVAAILTTTVLDAAVSSGVFAATATFITSIGGSADAGGAMGMDPQTYNETIGGAAAAGSSAGVNVVAVTTTSGTAEAGSTNILSLLATTAVGDTASADGTVQAIAIYPVTISGSVASNGAYDAVAAFETVITQTSAASGPVSTSATFVALLGGAAGAEANLIDTTEEAPTIEWGDAAAAGYSDAVTVVFDVDFAVQSSSQDSIRGTKTTSPTIGDEAQAGEQMIATLGTNLYARSTGTLVPVINPNFQSPLNFRFFIKRAPLVTFFAQRVNIPGLNLPAVDTGSPMISLPQPGDHLDFEQLSCQFKVDEDLANYLEMHNWLRALGKPSFEEYEALRIGEPHLGLGLRSDITLLTLTSQRNVNLEVTFIDAFPVALSGLQFSTTDEDVDYLEATCTFRYSHYTIERRR